MQHRAPCLSTFAGETCSLGENHAYLHISRDGRLAWGEQHEELEGPSGFTVDVVEEDDDEDSHEVVDAVQHYAPFSHVVVTKAPIPKERRDCRRCKGTGVAYDPKTGEGPLCPCMKKESP